MDINKLIDLKKQNKVFILDKNRVRTGLREMVLAILREEALTREELREKLGRNKTDNSVYNLLKRYEKKGFIISLSTQGKILFVETKQAKIKGLI